MESVVEAGICNTCRSTNHKVEPTSQHLAPDLSLIMREAIVGLPHCVQTLHIWKWDTEGHAGPNESPVFPKQPQQIFLLV